MVDKLRSLARIVANEINKQNLFNNTTGKVQEKLSNVQNIVGAKYDTIVKQINNEVTMFQDANGPRLQLAPPVPKGIVKWWQWYQHLTGLDTVEVSREQVIAVQDKLFKCQDERRMLNRQAVMLNEKLKEIYSELIQTKRDDPKYVQLTVIENKSLQDHAKVLSELNLLEKEERDYFTLLATSIKEYHDSQTMNTQRYKYLSMLASALLAIMSLIGSMIYNNKRIVDVRNVIAQAQEKNETLVANSLQSLEDNFNSKLTDIVQKLESIGNINNVLHDFHKVNDEPTEPIQPNELNIEPSDIYVGESYTQNVSQRVELIKSCTIIALSILGIGLTKTLYG